MASTSAKDFTSDKISQKELDKRIDKADEDVTDLAKVEGAKLAKDVDEERESDDSLTFSNGVIEKIVALAVRDVDGVAAMKGGFFDMARETFGQENLTKGVSVEVTPDDAVRVNLSVLIEYGAYAPQIFEDVKEAVVKHVMGMTGLEVAGVNLRIEDVLTSEEIEELNDEDDDEE